MFFFKRVIGFILVFFATSAFVFTQETDLPEQKEADELRKKIAPEAPMELIGLSLWDTSVSLFLTGSWKGTLQGNLGYSFSPLGNSPVSPETPLLFTQEVDLTLALWLKEKWFVEANFLDDSALNTYRAGYQGLAGEFVQYAGIGNTGLDFPVFPYLDLGGDSPSSFGFYGHFISKNIDVHSLFRYDAAASEEKIFSGGRERTYSYIQPQSSVRGISFVLPDTDIDSDVLVYIEDETGSIRDSSGRRWRLAGPSEYAAGRTQGLLELGVRPGGMTAVAYSKGADSRPWAASMGYYAGAAGEFLHNVQQWFDPLRGIKLEIFPQCGGAGNSSLPPNLRRPGEVLINGSPALVVFEPGTFSPFERQNRYEAPSSMSEEAALVRVSSGTAVQGFELVPPQTNFRTQEIPVYAAVETRRFIYELLAVTGSFDRRDPSSCWPLALLYPEIYLPGADAFTGDMALRFTNYGGSDSGEAGGYFIGVDIIPGSIQVWRSGIQDPNFYYNLSSGEVTLSVPAGENELVRITYLKRSDETRLGSIAAGLGAVYSKPASPFSLSAALGIRWNLSDSSYSEEDASSPGTAGLSAKASWDYDNLKAHIAAGIAFEQMDTTGLYRAAGMEGNEIALAMPVETSFISNPPTAVPGLDISNRADLVYRNYYDNNVAGSTLMPIDWNGSNLISGQNRPYPAKDPQFGSGTQVMVAEFTLNDNKKWTGFQIPLGFDSEFLAGCSEMEIPYRLYGFNPLSSANFKLIIQIGSLSGRDFAFAENPDLVWEELLFDLNAETVFHPEARIARFKLRDADRLKLGDAKYLRIIAVYGGAGEEVRGRVLLAPPIVRGASFRAVTFDGVNVKGPGDLLLDGRNIVSAGETVEFGSNTLEAAYGDIIDRLHSAGGRQRVLKIEWENMDRGISAGADGRIGSLPLADYRELSFFVKAPEIDEQLPASGALSFIAAAGPDSLAERELEAHVPLAALRQGKWSKVTIRYRGSNTGVFVDGGSAQGAWFRYAPRNRDSVYTALLITPEEGMALEDGSMCIDEIILEEASLVYRLNGGAAVEYNKPGTLFSFREIPVLADFMVSSALESEFRGDSIQEEDSQINGSMMNRSRAEISVLGVKFYGNLAFSAGFPADFSAEKDMFLWSADHGISRNIGLFSVKEAFFASPQENSANHALALGFSSPFYANFDAAAKHEFSRLERRWNLDFGYRSPNVYIPSAAVNAQAAWTSKDGKIEKDENYGNLWVRTWRPMVPDTGEGAEGRKTAVHVTITEGTKPVGFIVSLDGTTDFMNANNVTRSENSAFLDVPVAMRGSQLNFRAGRSFKKHISFSGNDAIEDGAKFFESINDSLPLWGVIPFYSLFSVKLDDAMNSATENSPSFDTSLYTAFHDHFGIKAALPAVYSIAAFVVPSSAGIRLERVLEQKLDTRAGRLNLAGSLGFSAMNMFGVMGYLPLFKFYKSDEFTNGIETSVIIPAGEEVSWRIQSAAGAGFYGFSEAQLNFTNTLTLRSEWVWMESIRADWTVPLQKSLLSIFYAWIAGAAEKQRSWLGLSSLLNSEYEQLRCESLELSLEKNTDLFRWKLSLGHESIIRILGKLNFSVFAKLNMNENTQNENFSFDALLGVTIRVSF